MKRIGRTCEMLPYQAVAPFDWPGLLDLIHRAFAGMEGRIDPPSSLHRLTAQALATQSGEVWVIGTPPVACVILTPQTDSIYAGKLAVDPAAQRQGHARRLLGLAAERAMAMGLGAVELQTRVELVENHAFFHHLGFVQTASSAHPGFDRPTSLTFRKPFKDPHA